MLASKNNKNIYSDFFDKTMVDDETINAFKKIFSIPSFNYPHCKGTNQSYTKFIILGSMRTGSTMLANLLMTHPNAVCFHELFQKNPTFFYPGFPLPSDANIQTFRDTYPVKFLNTFVYKSYLPQISAVGFKLFYDQAQQENLSKIWDYITNDGSIQIIHLARKNLFHSFVSYQLSLFSNKWARVDPNIFNIINSSGLSQIFLKNSVTDTEIKHVLTLSVNDCENFFISTEKKMNESLKLLKNNPLISVYYEDICRDAPKELTRILSFIKLPDEPLYCSIKKQNTKKVQDYVSNYSDLKNYFINSKWSNFFFD